MFPLFALSFGEATEVVTNNPITSAGWAAAVYAVLRIVWAQWGDKLPSFIQAIFEKLPTFPGKKLIAPVVTGGLADAIKRLVDEALKQNVPPDVVQGIANGLVEKLIPEVNKADVSALKTDVAKQCGVASPTPTEV